MENEWQPMCSAPRDGALIQVRIPGHGDDNIVGWGEGLLDSNGDDAGGWEFLEGLEPPNDWTSGICWIVNEDGVPSTQPTAWKALIARHNT